MLCDWTSERNWASWDSAAGMNAITAKATGPENTSTATMSTPRRTPGTKSCQRRIPRCRQSKIKIIDVHSAYSVFDTTMFEWWLITPCVIQARLTPISNCQVSGEIPVVALVRRMRTTCGRATNAPVTAPNQPRMLTNTIKDLLQLSEAAAVNRKSGGNNV